MLPVKLLTSKIFSLTLTVLAVLLGVISYLPPVGAQDGVGGKSQLGPKDFTIEAESIIEGKRRNSEESTIRATELEAPEIHYTGFYADTYEKGEADLAPAARLIFPGGRVSYELSYTAGAVQTRDLTLEFYYPEYAAPNQSDPAANYQTAINKITWQHPVVHPREEVRHKIELVLNQTIPLLYRELDVGAASVSLQVIQRVDDDTRELWQAIPIAVQHATFNQPVPYLQVAALRTTDDIARYLIEDEEEPQYASGFSFEHGRLDETGAGQLRLVVSRRQHMEPISATTIGLRFGLGVWSDKNDTSAPNLEAGTIPYCASIFQPKPFQLVSRPQQITEDSLRNLSDESPYRLEVTTKTNIWYPDSKPGQENDLESRVAATRYFAETAGALQLLKSAIPSLRTKRLMVAVGRELTREPKYSFDQDTQICLDLNLASGQLDPTFASADAALHELGHFIDSVLARSHFGAVVDLEPTEKERIRGLIAANTSGIFAPKDLQELEDLIQFKGDIYGDDHAGIINFSTSGSRSEGFAHFFAVALEELLPRRPNSHFGVLNAPEYAQDGKTITPFRLPLDNTLLPPFDHVPIDYSSVDHEQSSIAHRSKSGWSAEERSFAALLWFMTHQSSSSAVRQQPHWDSNADLGNLPPVSFFDILQTVTSEQTYDIKGFYQSVKSKYGNSFDTVFARFGHFNDRSHAGQDGWVYTAGEQVGAFGQGRFYRTDEVKIELNLWSRPARRGRGEAHNSLIKVATNLGSSQLTQLHMSYRFSEPYAAQNYDVVVPITNPGFLAIDEPSGIRPAKVVLMIPESPDAIVFDSDDVYRQQSLLDEANTVTDHIATASFTVLEGTTSPADTYQERVDRAIARYNAEHPEKPAEEDAYPPAVAPVGFEPVDQPTSNAPEGIEPPTGTVTSVDSAGEPVSLLEQLKNAPTRADAKRLLREILAQADKEYATVLLQAKADQKTTIAGQHDSTTIRAARDDFHSRAKTAYQAKTSTIYQARLVHRQRVRELR